MKKTFLLISLVIAHLCGHAQLTMTLQVQQNGIIQKPQLWNMLFVNANADVAYVQVSLILTSTSINQPVLTANTSVFTLNNGTTLIQSANVEPLLYDYPSPGFMNEDPNGFLPIGEYDACYTLSRQVGEIFEVVTESCVHLTVEPLSPPLLNIPADQDTLEEVYPQFSWLPPAPLNIFNNLSYDFVLVQVQEGQSPYEAIQQNIPVYTEGNLTDIFLNYPASNAPLDTAKTYAWQIIAKDNNEFAAQSEVWSFYVKGDTIPVLVVNKNPYVKLKQIPGASVFECEDILKIFYNNEANDTTLNYTISSLDSNDLNAVVNTGQVTVGFGENFIDIPLTGENRLLEGDVYLFSITNSRNETWSAKFLYHQKANE